MLDHPNSHLNWALFTRSFRNRPNANLTDCYRVVIGEEWVDQGGPAGGDIDGAGDGGGDQVADRGPGALPADISNALSEVETP